MEKIKRAFRYLQVSIISALLLLASLIGYTVLQPILFLNIPPTGAITEVFTGATTDGTLRNSDASYSTCRNSASANIKFSTSAYHQLGQRYDPSILVHYVSRSFFYFPTATIPDTATVTGAKLSIAFYSDLSDTDFDITIQNGQPTRPSDPLALADFDRTFYSGNGGTLNTNGIALNTYYNITLTEPSWINITSTTKLALLSSRDIAGTAPTGLEWVNVYYAETGTYKPKLYVEYTLPPKRELWVTSFDNTTGGWATYGASPYLNNSTSNWIWASTLNVNMSWFWFDITGLTPQQVWLWIEAHRVEKKIEVTLKTGTDELKQNITLTDFKTWHRINATSLLNTTLKVNNAKMSIKLKSDGLTYVYRAYLQVLAGPASVTEFNGEMLNKGVATKNIVVYSKWYDGDGLSSYAFNHNSSGSWLSNNISGALSGTSTWSNVTIQLNSASTKVVSYRFWANDSLGNWEKTKIYHIRLLWASFNQSYYVPITPQHDECETKLSYPYGRKSFYANGRWYTAPVAMTGEPLKHEFSYWHSADALTWTWGGIIINETIGDNSVYWYSKKIGNNWYAYYQLYYYTVAPEQWHIYYRKGQILANGTISWLQPQQTVQANIGANAYLAGIAITENDQVFMGYKLANGTLMLTMTNKTDGTWQTYQGYPKAVITNVDYGHVYDMVYDNDVYIIGAKNAEPIKGRFMDDHTLGAIVNVTTSTILDSRKFSGVSINRTLHLTYVASDLSIKYCHKNVTAWDVKDQLISNYVENNAYSTPVISVNAIYPSIAYINWWTVSDASCWLTAIEGGQWTPPKRIAVNAKDDISITVYPNTLNPHIYDGKLLLTSAQKNETNTITHQIWVYVFTPTTILNTGWNNVTVWEEDIGHTLGEVNASIWSDGIQFTVLSYYNGTYWTFRRGYSWNANVIVSSSSGTRFYIYVTVAGTWSHTYP